jgi:hypothetical protein
MKKNKNISDSQLQDLFKGISLESPSSGFAENLMLRIEKEAVKQRRKEKWIPYGQLAAGIIGILLLPKLAIDLCARFIPEFSFSFSFSSLKTNYNSISYNPEVIMIGVIILLLLAADTFFRKYANSRKK